MCRGLLLIALCLALAAAHLPTGQAVKCNEYTPPDCPVGCIPSADNLRCIDDPIAPHPQLPTDSERSFLRSSMEMGEFGQSTGNSGGSKKSKEEEPETPVALRLPELMVNIAENAPDSVLFTLSLLDKFSHESVKGVVKHRQRMHDLTEKITSGHIKMYKTRRKTRTTTVEAAGWKNLDEYAVVVFGDPEHKFRHHMDIHLRINLQQATFYFGHPSVYAHLSTAAESIHNILSGWQLMGLVDDWMKEAVQKMKDSWSDANKRVASHPMGTNLILRFGNAMTGKEFDMKANQDTLHFSPCIIRKTRRFIIIHLEKIDEELRLESLLHLPSKMKTFGWIYVPWNDSEKPYIELTELALVEFKVLEPKNLPRNSEASNK